MKSIQYTVRTIPADLDELLRQTAKATGKSLNEVIISVLEKGSGLNRQASFDDLDWFIGRHSLPASFDDSLEWLDAVPEEL